MKKLCLLMLLFAMLISSAEANAISGQLGGIEEPGYGEEGGGEGEGGWEEVEEEEEMTEEELERLQKEANEDTLRKLRAAYVPKEKIFFNNTVCAFGPQFREVSSNLTREWYMFTPVDLSEEGTQTYELIGGGMYVIGVVTVTVKSGRVAVDYEYFSKDIEDGREYFTFFPDFDSITRKDMDNFQKRFSYGKSYSIEDKLGGDTDVILFVCNTATFEKTSRGVYRYYENNEERVQLREQMLEMIGE